MFGVQAVPELTKSKTEPEGGDDIESGDTKAKPGEWGDGLQNVLEYLCQRV